MVSYVRASVLVKGFADMVVNRSHNSGKYAHTATVISRDLALV